MDRPTLIELFASLWPVHDYDAMPRIWRDENEGEGFSDVDATSGVPYEAADLAALAALLRAMAPEGHAGAAVEALEALSGAALARGAEVMVRDD